jgi:hypothetical protein
MIHRHWFLYGSLRSAAVGIGWTLHRQGGDYLESRYYREIEAPLDSCWLLGGMIGDGGRSIAYIALTRPRSAHPFTVDDVQRLDRLRPWLAHAFRRFTSADVHQGDEVLISIAGPKVLSGQLIVTSDGRLVHQAAGLEHLLRCSRESEVIIRATWPPARACPRRF